MNDLVTIDSYCELTKTELKKKNCFICNKHKYITELHHINPQKNKIKDINIKGIYESDLIYLCPNCHSYFHKILYKESKRKLDYLILSYWGENKNMREKIIYLRSKYGIN